MDEDEYRLANSKQHTHAGRKAAALSVETAREEMRAALNFINYFVIAHKKWGQRTFKRNSPATADSRVLEVNTQGLGPSQALETVGNIPQKRRI